MDKLKKIKKLVEGLSLQALKTLLLRHQGEESGELPFVYDIDFQSYKDWKSIYGGVIRKDGEELSEDDTVVIISTVNYYYENGDEACGQYICTTDELKKIVFREVAHKTLGLSHHYLTLLWYNGRL